MGDKFKVFVIIAVLVLGVATVGSTFLVLKMMNANQAANETQDGLGANGNIPTSMLKEVSLGESIMTNIAKEEDNISHFAKIQLSIGVDASNEKVYNAFTTSLSEHSGSVRDLIIEILGEQTYSMLSVTTSGKEKIAEEIITRLNELLDTNVVYEVYFQEYFIQ